MPNPASTTPASNESLSNLSQEQKTLAKREQNRYESKERFDEAVDKFLTQLKHGSDEPAPLAQNNNHEPEQDSVKLTFDKQLTSLSTPVSLSQLTFEPGTGKNSALLDSAASVHVKALTGSDSNVTESKNVPLPLSQLHTQKDVQEKSTQMQNHGLKMNEVSLELDEGITVVQQSFTHTTDGLLRAQIEKTQSTLLPTATSLVQADPLKNTQTHDINLIKETIHAQLHIKSRNNAKVDVELNSKELKINVQSLADGNKSFDAIALSELRSALEQKYPHLHVQLAVTREASENMQNESKNSPQSKHEQQRQGEDSSRGNKEQQRQPDDAINDDDIA